MLASRVNCKLCSPRQATQLSRAVAPALYHASSSSSVLGLRLSSSPSNAQTPPSSTRSFSTTPANHLRDFFPPKETEYIRKTPPAWPHHGFTYEEMTSVVPGHREPRTLGDMIAWRLIRIARWSMDTVTGLSKDQKTDKKNPTTAVVADKPLTEAQWVCSTLEESSTDIARYNG